MKSIWAFVIGALLLCFGPAFNCTAIAQTEKHKENQTEAPVRAADRTTMLMSDEIRHQLVTLPYYGVFDWLEGEIRPDRTVILQGEVVRPTTKSDAENRVKSVEGVAKVVNNIEVLPLSGNDDEIRRATYRAIYKFDSPLFQYAIRAVPPIHIIVKGGRVTLKGVVLNEMDKQLAETAARGVPNTFEVTNELMIEKKNSN